MPTTHISRATINPIGSSDVEAKIQLEPGKPDLYHLVIDPGPSTGIHLKFSPVAQPGVEPGGDFDLRMEDVKGRFFFDNGTVTMHDVGFLFYGAPVEFATGTVVVEDSGRFRLGVKDLRARGVTVLMVEQNAKSALKISDDGLVLELGRTRMSGSARALLEDPRVGQLFLGGTIESESVP